MPEERQDNQPADHIDINLEDLGEDVPGTAANQLPAIPAGAASDDLLVISLDDLQDEPPAYGAPGGGQFPGVSDFPAVSPQAYALAGKGKKSIVSGGLVGSLLIQMFIAGGLGGLLAWGITEPTLANAYASNHISVVYLHTMIFFAIVGGIIGLFLGAVEGLSTFNWSKAALGGGISLLIGAAGGALAGILGQTAYGALGGTGETLGLTQIIARAIGWAIAGLFIGLGQGAAGRSLKKVINGLCGGAIGGFVGGLLFDPIGIVMSLTEDAGFASRLIALVVIGAASGAAVGLIAELRKEAWVLVVGGPLTGKQFILDKPMTTLGSSAMCDIALLKDQAIASQHCVIEASGHQYALRDLGTSTGTLVNGRPVQRQALRSGDIIQLGQTALEYQDRALPNAPVG